VGKVKASARRSECFSAVRTRKNEEMGCLYKVGAIERKVT